MTAAHPVVAEVDAALRAAGSPERAEKERAYLKSDLRHYGVTMPAIRTITRAAVGRHPDLDHDQLLGVVEGLWAVPVHERRVAAAELLEAAQAQLVPADLPLLERLLREARTWALVDPLAASVAGPLIDRHPELGAELDRWAADDDMWVQRAALLVHLLPLRRGEGDFDRFARLADGLLDDRRFFIRKAIGWVLRDTGRRRPDLVAAWLLPRAARASGVTIREAVKPLSPEQRAEVLAAR